MKPFAQILSVLMAASAGLCVSTAFAAGAPAAPDAAKGQAIFGQTCVACHGPDSNSVIPMYPKLAQQHPEYIFKQLDDFKTKKRDNAIMFGMVATLPDAAAMRDVAAYVASQKVAPGAAKNPDTVLLGQQIYRGGIADRSIPSCSGCHGPSGAGMSAQFPRLGGQHAEYVVTQLTAFRDGTRNNNTIMSDVAAKLNDREIKALADYIDGLH
ncbi:MAG: cytochrome c4 [Burkholderiaceae bacterium]|jgi:cytochrome c553|nr:cytochrome c4 [Burkholderiaceae bacterium]